MTAETHMGEFFAIDSRIWAKVTACGMNEAVAYLALACGTGHSNKTTSWSTKAVMKCGGLGWERAKNAIAGLITGGFIRRAESHTENRPRYELASHRELAEHEATKNPPAVPNLRERELLADIQAGRQPKKKTARDRAELLHLRDVLCKDAQGVYALPEPATEDSGDYSIWLPNAIVSGTSSGEESPIRKLRSAGFIWTLRLFIDFYSAQNLRDDGGIGLAVIREMYDREQVGQQGAHILWGFKAKNRTAQWNTGPLAIHRSRGGDPLWESIRLLVRMGLLSFVPHIFENDSDIAEPIHAFGLGRPAELPIEREIGDAADRAARAMALPSKLEEAEDDGFLHFCPILHTRPSAQMIGVARLTYRPRTRRTAAWFAEIQESGPIWIDAFNKLSEKGTVAGLRRALNYA